MNKIPATAEQLPIPTCLACARAMQLCGIEWETERDDLYTFDCPTCDAVETQLVTCQ